MGRAASTNFLRDVTDEAASRSYLVMETKTGSYLQLPDVVLAMAHHLKTLRNGEPSDLMQHLAAIPV